MAKDDRDLLSAALAGYKVQRTMIDGHIAQIEKRLGFNGKKSPARETASGEPAASQSTPQRRHQISAEGKERIAAAQRKRWAAKKRADAQASRPKVRTAGGY